MSVDAFTAQVMLEAAATNPGKSNEVLSDLYKNLTSKEDGGPSQKDIDFFNKHKGKKVKVKYTTHEGILYKLNTSTGGFYPGSRFPFYVKITNEGKAQGCIFEYDAGQVELME